MARPGVHVHCLVSIVLLALVLVHDPDANGRAQSDAKLGTGLNLYAVLLVARCRNGRLSGPTSRHLRLDIIFREAHAGRASVDDGTDTETVGLAIAGECQDCATISRGL
jgi:hypothetical protein